MSRKFLISCLALGALAAAPAFAEATLDEILATHVESKGGIDAIKAIGTIRMQGRLTMQPGMEAPLTIEMKRPNSVRMEFSFQGMTGVQAFDGESGWQVMPFTGSTTPEKLAGEELEMMREQADFDGPLIEPEKKGYTIELVGTEDVDGTEAYKLLVTRKSGEQTTVYLDTEYCLELKTVSKRKIQGMEMETSSTMGDYKEVAGVMMPHSVTQQMGGHGGPSISFETIEANVDLDGDRFAMPAVEEEAAGEEAEEGK